MKKRRSTHRRRSLDNFDVGTTTQYQPVILLQVNAGSPGKREKKKGHGKAGAASPVLLSPARAERKEGKKKDEMSCGSRPDVDALSYDALVFWIKGEPRKGGGKKKGKGTGKRSAGTGNHDPCSRMVLPLTLIPWLDEGGKKGKEKKGRISSMKAGHHWCARTLSLIPVPNKEREGRGGGGERRGGTPCPTRRQEEKKNAPRLPFLSLSPSP